MNLPFRKIARPATVPVQKQMLNRLLSDVDAVRLDTQQALRLLGIGKTSAAAEVLRGILRRME